MADTAQLNALEKLCVAIGQASAGVLQWQWDSRFGAAQAVFTAADAARVSAALAPSLPLHWDGASIATAPATVRGQVDQLGGLDHDQQLFACDPVDGARLFAAWWPWRNGTSVSLRIFALAVDDAPSRKDELTALVRKCFGVG